MNARQLARIRRMEEDFNRVREAVKALDGGLSEYESVRQRITRLRRYQESGQWLQDFEADERGELPAYQELHRGVLSEDGLNDLFDDIAAIRARLEALAAVRDHGVHG